MKFGCRSQSWYIIIQNPDMISSQVINRASRMFTSVFHSTANTESDFDAPVGTSLYVIITT